MITRNHNSPELARKEARRAGYWPQHQPDGRDVWARDDGRRVALVREERARSTVWHWHPLAD